MVLDTRGPQGHQGPLVLLEPPDPMTDSVVMTKAQHITTLPREIRGIVALLGYLGFQV